jgi:uncharacterized membrane protein
MGRMANLTGLALLMVGCCFLLLYWTGRYEFIPLLSLAPFIESRYAIPLSVKAGFSPLFAYFLCVSLNLLVIPAVYGFMNLFFPPLSRKISILRDIVSYAEEKAKGKEWTFPFLVLFVAVPLPLTGAYTATLIAYLLHLDWKKASLAISLGVLLAGFITLAIEVGISQV